MKTMSWFHEGEREAQRRAGVREVADRNGGMFSDTIMAGARPFLRRQSLLVAGGDDDRGRLWASLLLGDEGFVSADDGRALQVDLLKSAPDADDPLWPHVGLGQRLGLLSIELATRRRLRVNGLVSAKNALHMTIDVVEAYANCPKYIQRRTLQVSEPLPSEEASSEPGATGTAIARGAVLDHPHRALIANADTFFVASRHPDRGPDASHRGGNPGFIALQDDRTLRIPDYAGNSLFNTLGNFVSDPAAGLLFVDFDAGRSLHLTGRAEILWHAETTARDATGGTGRYWLFHVEDWVSLPLSHRVRWELLDYSPWNPA